MKNLKKLASSILFSILAVAGAMGAILLIILFIWYAVGLAMDYPYIFIAAVFTLCVGVLTSITYFEK